MNKNAKNAYDRTAISQESYANKFTQRRYYDFAVQVRLNRYIILYCLLFCQTLHI